LGQRQSCLTTALSGYLYNSFFPIDIGQAKLDNISRPKSQASKEKQNRAISPADGR
jgi:hypothetical protein